MKINKVPLKGNGDFRSDESIELLKQADIVVTNPPFSLFREYVKQLMECDKKFLIIGHQNAIGYKEIFPFIKENKVWLGPSITSGDREFGVPTTYPLSGVGSRVDNEGNKFVRVTGIRWFTNLKYTKERKNILFNKKYYGNEELYPEYINYNAINIDKTKDIPCDYEGIMGVPITFLDKYNPDQFEILECHEPCINLETLRQVPSFKEYKSRQVTYNGKLCQKTYHRLFIRNKNPQS